MSSTNELAAGILRADSWLPDEVDCRADSAAHRAAPWPTTTTRTTHRTPSWKRRRCSPATSGATFAHRAAIPSMAAVTGRW